jgi:Tfp pilus assembly protein FimT
MVLMSMQSAVRSVRLAEAVTDYANLLQQARIRAVQDDKYYTVRTSISNTAPPKAFVDIAGTGTYAAGDPTMVFPQGVTRMSYASGPALSNLESKFLPSGSNALATIDTTTAGPTFSPRGLPCTPIPGAGGTTTCPSVTPTSFIVFVQNNQNTQWGAITVTPAARIREWVYDGSSGNWLPRN